MQCASRSWGSCGREQPLEVTGDIHAIAGKRRMFLFVFFFFQTRESFVCGLGFSVLFAILIACYFLFLLGCNPWRRGSVCFLGTWGCDGGRSGAGGAPRSLVRGGGDGQGRIQPLALCTCTACCVSSPLCEELWMFCLKISAFL